MELPKKKYNLIYCDPPWQYNEGRVFVDGAAELQYPTMSIEELKALPIKELADKDCVMFLWVTFPKLKDGLELMEEWGFNYRTVAFVWIKMVEGIDKERSGIGFHTNSNAEIVLLGKRGRVDRINKDVKQIIKSKITTHSSKPHEAYSRIERLYGDIPKIELFARVRREGWDSWGNQVPKDTQKLLFNNTNI